MLNFAFAFAILPGNRRKDCLLDYWEPEQSVDATMTRKNLLPRPTCSRRRRWSRLPFASRRCSGPRDRGSEGWRSSFCYPNQELPFWRETDWRWRSGCWCRLRWIRSRKATRTRRCWSRQSSTRRPPPRGRWVWCCWWRHRFCSIGQACRWWRRRECWTSSCSRSSGRCSRCRCVSPFLGRVCRRWNRGFHYRTE